MLTSAAASTQTAVTSWQADYGDSACQLPIPPHWRIGGVFLRGVGTLLLGIPLYLLLAKAMPPFCRGAVLARRLPVPTESSAESDALPHS
ncbi:hypothetical protein [Nocardia uniformis]|uniref:hypothetical protein n=1 Tax=Nocardia uniformis TaxID=53432 RepID=UPI0014716ECE|nr:hypothetical protein [Nocardia uniformis]